MSQPTEMFTNKEKSNTRGPKKVSLNDNVRPSSICVFCES